MKSALLLIPAVLAVYPLFSQGPVDANTDDPPGRVARLNWLTGDVSFQPAGLEDWTAATLNYPLTTSDHLFTGKESRAELHIGANAIRLDANSNFGFLNLDDSIVQVSLTEGSMEIRLLQLPDDDSFEIATPNGAVTLLRPGDYRVDIDSEHDTSMLTVRTGQAELFSGSSSVMVRSQQTAFFQADQTTDIRAMNRADDFDDFTLARDSAPGSSDNNANFAYRNQRPQDRYSDDVSTADLIADGVTGAEDLDAYGSWQFTGGYGQTWVPPVDPSWVPYSDGNWAYVEPWGWTWIDAAPWGFTPFHYGRWAYTGYRWVWVPGSRRTRRVYAPALVVFMGGGPADNVSWFPLAPNDPWTPPWRARNGLSGVPRLSTNRSVPGVVQSISQREFITGGHARPVIGPPDGDIVGSSPALVPIVESVLIRPVRIKPPTVNRNKSLISRTAPPPAPVSFKAKQALLVENRGRPLAPQQVETLRRQTPAAVIQRPQVRSAPAPLNSPANGPKQLPKGDRPAPQQTKPTRENPNSRGSANASGSRDAQVSPR